MAKVRQNGKYGFVNKTGKVVVPIQYDEAYRFSGGKAKVGILTGREDLGPYDYDGCMRYHNDSWECKLRSKEHEQYRNIYNSYYIDKTGKRLN